MRKASVGASMVSVINVDKDKCVNCHMCIAVCPVKYCIDGSGEKVSINADLCIACGSCVIACVQKARSIKDDTALFLEALERKEPIIAVAAPALVSSFPGMHRRFLGWLKRSGVDACFDVSFGAELTVKSYLDHIGRNKPRLVIAQPCPAIVSYIEVYRPELLPHLAPADSPMLHTIRMVGAYYPQYRNHKVLVLSPCAAKRREFEETGIGDFNVTFKSFETMLKEKGVNLSLEAEAGFDNPPAERAVVFSTPGGLLRTAMREVPGIESKARKIEGTALIYPYLNGLAESLKKGTNPLLVDCLNCDFGCNAGPGTLNHGKSPDDFEQPVEILREQGELFYGGRKSSDKIAKKRLEKVVSRYWKPGQYARSYVDRSSNYQLKMPTEAQLKEIYGTMRKEREEDYLNCASCGYKSCEGMAIAVFNGLNKKNNCHLYRQRVIELEQAILEKSSVKLHDEIERATGMVDGIKSSLVRLQEESTGQFSAIEESAAAVEEMIAMLSNASSMASSKKEQIAKLSVTTMNGERDMNATVNAIRKVSEGVSGIGKMISVIHDVADKTNLLSMNAAIQAAHAGNAGKGFAVVAAEIRKLAEATGGNARDISGSLGAILSQIKDSDTMTARTGESIKSISHDVMEMADEMGSLINSLGEMASGGTEVTQGIEELRNVSMTVKEMYTAMTGEVGTILLKIKEISATSEETRENVASISR